MIKNVNIVMFMALSSFALHASDDGDRKNVAAAREDVDQKKNAASSNAVCETESSDGVKVEMLDKWDEHKPVALGKIGCAKFYSKNATIAYGSEHAFTKGSINFADYSGKIRKSEEFNSTGLLYDQADSFVFNDSAQQPLIAIRTEKELQIRNMKTGKVLHTKSFSDTPGTWQKKSIQFTKDGNNLLLGTSDWHEASLQLCDLEKLQSKVTFKDDGSLRVARVSDDGTYVASGTHNAISRTRNKNEAEHIVRIFDTRMPGAPAREIETVRDISDMRFMPDAYDLVVSETYNGGTINTWDIATGSKKKTIAHSACHIAMDESGNHLVSCGMIGCNGTPIRPNAANYVRIWDLKTSALIAKINAGTHSSFKGCDISPDGNSVLAVSDNYSDAAILLWSRKKQSLLEKLGGQMKNFLNLGGTLRHDVKKD